MKGRLDSLWTLVAVLIVVILMDFAATPIAYDFGSAPPSPQESVVHRSPVVLSTPASAASASPRPTLAPTAGETHRPGGPVASSPAAGAWRQIRATWYSLANFGGQRTACGQTYTATLVGLASNELACGTMVQLMFAGAVLPYPVPVVDRHGHTAPGHDFFDLTEKVCTDLGPPPGHCWTGPIYWRLAP